MKKSELRQIIKEEITLLEQETAIFNDLIKTYGQLTIQNDHIRKLVIQLVKKRIVPTIQLKRLLDASRDMEEVMGQIQSMWQ